MRYTKGRRKRKAGYPSRVKSRIVTHSREETVVMMVITIIPPPYYAGFFCHIHHRSGRR